MLSLLFDNDFWDYETVLENPLKRRKQLFFDKMPINLI